MRKFILPVLVGVLGIISFSTITSIAPQYAVRQAFFIALGAIVYFFARKTSFAFLLRLAPLWYGLLCVLLVIALFMPSAKGASRWIDIGFISFQPSQLAIPATLLLFGWIQQKKLRSLQTMVAFVVSMAVPAALIFVEPDLGTTVLYLLICSLSLFLFCNWKQMLSLLGIGVVVAAVGWFTVVQDYQKQRITSFLEPEAARDAASYNAYQSTIAVGSGQMLGRGAGKGIKSHLRFLTERHTVVFCASFAEECLFLWSSILISIYISLCLICLYTAFHADTWSKALFAAAIGTFVGFQTFYNIGMNAGLFPITGVPLPLASYGGTAFIAVAGMIGMIDQLLQTLPKKVSIHID